jgi:hypothetical protein
LLYWRKSWLIKVNSKVNCQQVVTNDGAVKMSKLNQRKLPAGFSSDFAKSSKALQKISFPLTKD